MPAELRIPTTNTIANIHYTMGLTLAAGATQFNLLLDTGAGLLVVDGGDGGYNPATDAAAKTTKLLQTATFETGSFMAAVVRTPISLPVVGAATPVILPNANVAVTYQEKSGIFGNADGILGLAYAALDTALRMPADTFQTKYPADQIHLGQPADLDPFITQLADAGLAPDVFAFSVRRSMTSQASDDPDTDPLNSGLFILGGGHDCTDLYKGTFTNVAVVHEQYYGTNLQSVRVGTKTIPVPPVAPGVRAFSNSIIDSGAFILKLDQGLYASIIAAFAAIRPAFAESLQASSTSAGSGCDQTTLKLADWPVLTLVFQGSDGTPAPVRIAPQDYWQFDCRQKGRAIAMITGDGGSLAGQSILGLPLFAGHFVVFDRTASNGHGVISFADHAVPSGPLIA
jgi:hypothetical protein